MTPVRIHQLFFIVFSLSLFLSFSACAKRSRSIVSINDQQTFASAEPPLNNLKIQPRMNVNTASSKELEALPGIGRGLAERIIEHRDKYGPFRRAEHLIVVRGISERRFRALRDLIIAE